MHCCFIVIRNLQNDFICFKKHSENSIRVYKIILYMQYHKIFIWTMSIWRCWSLAAWKRLHLIHFAYAHFDYVVLFVQSNWDGHYFDSQPLFESPNCIWSLLSNVLRAPFAGTISSLVGALAVWAIVIKKVHF